MVVITTVASSTQYTQPRTTSAAFVKKFISTTSLMELRKKANIFKVFLISPYKHYLKLYEILGHGWIMIEKKNVWDDLDWNEYAKKIIDGFESNKSFHKLQNINLL